MPFVVWTLSYNVAALYRSTSNQSSPHSTGVRPIKSGLPLLCRGLLSVTISTRVLPWQFPLVHEHEDDIRRTLSVVLAVILRTTSAEIDWFGITSSFFLVSHTAFICYGS